MGDSGYTSTEKTKILYEESLKDIRELTGRLEAVSSQVLEANRMADADSERVGAAQHVASDVAAAERQKTLVWAIGSLTVLSMFMFGTGMALGSQVGLGAGFLAAIALGIGLVGGMVLCQTLIAGDQVKVKEKTTGIKAVVKAESESRWTEAELMKVALNTRETANTRVLNACRDVLVNGNDMFASAQKAQLGHQQIKNAVERLQERKKLNLS